MPVAGGAWFSGCVRCGVELTGKLKTRVVLAFNGSSMGFTVSCNNAEWGLETAVLHRSTKISVHRDYGSISSAWRRATHISVLAPGIRSLSLGLRDDVAFTTVPGGDSGMCRY
jgi:hypothetical protein